MVQCILNAHKELTNSWDVDGKCELSFNCMEECIMKQEEYVVTSLTCDRNPDNGFNTISKWSLKNDVQDGCMVSQSIMMYGT